MVVRLKSSTSVVPGGADPEARLRVTSCARQAKVANSPPTSRREVSRAHGM